MSNDTHPLSAPGTGDLAAHREVGAADTGPLSAADLPPEEYKFEDDEAQPLDEDSHSRPVAALDIRSAPAPATVGAEATSVQPPEMTPGKPPPLQAVQPAVQATQAVVDTAKQATHQVTAAVQQQAQKITVAPRKAIYRGKRFLVIYGGLVGAAGVWRSARRHRYFVGDVGITRLIQRPNFKLYDELMHAVSQLGWRWISVGTRGSLTTLMWAAGFRMETHSPYPPGAETCSRPLSRCRCCGLGRAKTW